MATSVRKDSATGNTQQRVWVDGGTLGGAISSGLLVPASQATVVAISSGTTSAAFSLAGRLNFARLSATGSIRTLKIQFTHDGGTTWTDTGISISTSASLPVILDSNALAAIAGLTGFENILRLNLSGSDSVTVTFFSRG